MATIVTRSGKGAPLSLTEIDDNFSNLNDDKAEVDNPTFTGYITGKLKFLAEKLEIVAAGGTGTLNIDLDDSTAWYYTSNNSANWTFNIRGNGSTTLNSMLDVGDSITIAVLMTNGASAYYPTAHQVDGSAVTVKWQGGTAPTLGNSNAIDVYTYTIIKTANATFTVIGSQTKYS